MAQKSEEIKSKIPEFSSIREEAAFWDTHSLADYWDEFEDEELVFEPQEDTCPKCGGRMNIAYFDVRLAGGKAVLYRVKVYRCPTLDCGTTVLSKEAKAEMDEIAGMLRKGKLEGLELMAVTA
ncbi:MAG: hypothetical protein FJ014_05605 [Chloroflexi bacterium]|nr:hypothetical protein [Chloroflexota bacterium]